MFEFACQITLRMLPSSVALSKRQLAFSQSGSFKTCFRHLQHFQMPLDKAAYLGKPSRTKGTVLQTMSVSSPLTHSTVNTPPLTLSIIETNSSSCCDACVKMWALKSELGDFFIRPNFSSALNQTKFQHAIFGEKLSPVWSDKLPLQNVISRVMKF